MANRPTIIGGTIILLEGDVLPFSEKPYTLYDFNISTKEINNAKNIIYIDEIGTIKFLKIKNKELFKESNTLI